MPRTARDPMPDAETLPQDAETDPALMARVAAGDRAAFDLLASRHLLRLRRAAMRVLDDPAAAEDVAQDAMMRAWAAAGRYDPARAPVGTWLHRIAVNLALDQLRRRRPSAELPAELADTAPRADHAMAERQRRAALAQGIAGLPERQRTALSLVYGREWSGAEAARAMDVSLRALEGLLRRGRLMLRDHLRARDA